MNEIQRVASLLDHGVVAPVDQAIISYIQKTRRDYIERTQCIFRGSCVHVNPAAIFLFDQEEANQAFLAAAQWQTPWLPTVLVDVICLYIPHSHFENTPRHGEESPSLEKDDTIDVFL